MNQQPDEARELFLAAGKPLPALLIILQQLTGAIHSQQGECGGREMLHASHRPLLSVSEVSAACLQMLDVCRKTAHMSLRPHCATRFAVLACEFKCANQHMLIK
jgi:hypothetical protein